MVHVEVVMAWVVCVQDDLFAALGSRVEEDVDAEGEVVEEEVASLVQGATVGVRGVDLHLVLAFEEDPIGTS